MIGRACLEKEGEFARYLIRSHRRELEIVQTSRKREKSFDDRLQTIGLGGDDGESLRRFRVRRVPRHVCRKPLDCGERIFYFVSESRRDPLECTRSIFPFAADFLPT